MKPVGRYYRSVFRSTRRFYATQIAGKRAEGKPLVAVQDAKVTKLSNGIAVASLENCSPVCQVAVIYNAGPRYEPIDKLGLTHCLRVASNLRSQKSTAFAIARNLQQLGATLSCTTTKEHMIYTMECLRRDIDQCTELLSQVAVSPSFKHWELADIERLQRIDVALLNHSPHSRLMELVHKAAYRETLGRSLYMPENRIGSFTADNLEEFVSTRYVSGNMAVAGVGVDHDTLTELVNKMPVCEAPRPAVMEKAKFYHGGEERVQLSSALVHAALVTEAVSLSSKDMLSVAVISKVLGGSDTALQYSSTKSTNKLYTAAASAVPDLNFALTGIHSAYSDSGLFGVQTVSSPQNIGKVLQTIVSMMRQLNKSGITDAELNRAKQQLKLSLSVEVEDGLELVEKMAMDVLLLGKVNLPWTVEKDIDALTLDAVAKVGKRIIAGRPSLAVIGNTASTPRLSELM